MKCAIVFDNKIVNLILAEDAAAGDLQRFADAAGPGHTAELLTTAQGRTAWIGAARTSQAGGWSEPEPASSEIAPFPALSEIARNEQFTGLADVVERQAKELDELRAQVARITAGVSAFL
jgi:hypothetical protein